MGGVTEVPAGYVLEFILSVGNEINDGMIQWGDALLTRYTDSLSA